MGICERNAPLGFGVEANARAEVLVVPGHERHTAHNIAGHTCRASDLCFLCEILCHTFSPFF